MLCLPITRIAEPAFRPFHQNLGACVFHLPPIERTRDGEPLGSISPWTKSNSSTGTFSTKSGPLSALAIVPYRATAATVTAVAGGSRRLGKYYDHLFSCYQEKWIFQMNDPVQV